MGIELIQVSKNSYYCSGRLSIGVYMKDNNAILIDSGLDESSAKQIDKAIQSAKCKVVAIINTHSHADHCGGNAYFQKKYPDLKVYSTKYEQHYIEDPINEPRCFCKGAQPLSELRNKFLEAKQSDVTNTIHPYQDQSITIGDKTFSIITLPGHTPGMIAVVSPDNVLYTGDAIFGDETLKKHGVLFYTHIADTLASFAKLSKLTFDAVVFYHGGLMKAKWQNVIETHTSLVLDTQQTILLLVKENSLSLTDLTQQVMKKFGCHVDPVVFTLTETCVQAYVANLQQHKKIELCMEDAKLVIKASIDHSACNNESSMTATLSNR